MMLVLLLVSLGMTGVAHADCKSEVDAAFEKLRHSASFRMRTTIVGEQGALKMTVDYVLPDRMHQKVQLTGSEGAVELIVIGKKAWSNNGQEWAEMPAEYAEHVANQVRQSVVEPPARDSEYICLGDKELEGKVYTAYQALISANPSLDRTADALRGVRHVQTVYIDKGSLLPERNIVTTEKSDEVRLFDGTFSFPEGLKVEAPTVAANP